MLQAFHAALSALAARSELGTLEDELVRDLVILRMKNVNLQDTLNFGTLTTEEVMKRIIKFKDSKKKKQQKLVWSRNNIKFGKEVKTRNTYVDQEL